jgi:hypothetical protein
LHQSQRIRDKLAQQLTRKKNNKKRTPSWWWFWVQIPTTHNQQEYSYIGFSLGGKKGVGVAPREGWVRFGNKQMT